MGRPVAATATPRRQRRRNLPEPVKYLVGVRAGGCCELCGKYLLEGAITGQPARLGEFAHIVGQSTGERSPRGQSPLSAEERDSPDNIMLICAGDHDDIDRDGSTDVATIEMLKSKKQAHEERILLLVKIAHDQHSSLLRLIGDVQGAAVQIPLHVAAGTVARAGRYPKFDLGYDRAGVEIDLRGIPGETEGGADYWRQARRSIDEHLARLREGVRGDDVLHVSLFAFARLPLLIYIGAALDDTFLVDTFQLHRSDGSWDWKEDPEIQFAFSRPDALGEEAVLVVNVSGTIDDSQLPTHLVALPRIKVEPVDTATGTDAIVTRASLANFEGAIRDAFASLEIPNKAVKRLHVVAATPVSASVAIGRAHNAPVHPALVVYHRTGTTYELALEIP
jgi:hypothetical protein